MINNSASRANYYTARIITTKPSTELAQNVQQRKLADSVQVHRVQYEHAECKDRTQEISTLIVWGAALTCSLGEVIARLVASLVVWTLDNASLSRHWQHGSNAGLKSVIIHTMNDEVNTCLPVADVSSDGLVSGRLLAAARGTCHGAYDTWYVRHRLGH